MQHIKVKISGVIIIIDIYDQRLRFSLSQYSYCYKTLQAQLDNTFTGCCNFFFIRAEFHEVTLERNKGFIIQTTVLSTYCPLQNFDYFSLKFMSLNIIFYTFLEVLPDALKTDCSKCTSVQKNRSEKVIRFLMKNRASDFDRLSAKFDPTGEFKKNLEKLEQQLNATSTAPIKSKL